MALLAALAWPAGIATAASADEGQRAFDLGKFAEARRVWVPRAEAGDPVAQLGLGVLYDLGRSEKQDASQAFFWYRRAADAGLADAAFNVAVMLDSGQDVARDARQAALWYARAALRGNRRAQYNLGNLYAAGDGVSPNLEVAAAWYRSAVEGGVAAASAKLKGLERAARPVATFLAAPTLLEPVHSVAIPNSDRVSLALVWDAPAQPVPVQFFVQILALGPGGEPAVFADYFERPAALVELKLAAGPYAWRVYTVGEGLSHYAASDWGVFSIGDAADVVHAEARDIGDRTSGADAGR